MSAQLSITGDKELQRDFATMTKRMTADAQARIDSRAESTAAEIAGAYPRKTGNLAAGVRVVPADTATAVAKGRVVNIAPHAMVYEIGSMGRYTATGAYRGSMPAANVFIPRMMRARRALSGEYAAIMRAEGLKVSGT